MNSRRKFSELRMCQEYFDKGLETTLILDRLVVNGLIQICRKSPETLARLAEVVSPFSKPRKDFVPCSYTATRPECREWFWSDATLADAAIPFAALAEFPSYGEQLVTWVCWSLEKYFEIQYTTKRPKLFLMNRQVAAVVNLLPRDGVAEKNIVTVFESRLTASSENLSIAEALLACRVSKSSPRLRHALLALASHDDQQYPALLLGLRGESEIIPLIARGLKSNSSDFLYAALKALSHPKVPRELLARDGELHSAALNISFPNDITTLKKYAKCTFQKIGWASALNDSH